MPKDPVALTIPDLTTFARALARALPAEGGPPGHLSLMNHIARAAGYANYQALRAARSGTSGPGAPEVPPGPQAPQPRDPADDRRLARALRLFDSHGLLLRWPRRGAQQQLCIWVIWSRLPARTTLSEPQINALIDRWHRFGDRAVQRRGLIDMGLAERTRDGSQYRRIERPPPAEALALISALAHEA